MSDAALELSQQEEPIMITLDAQELGRFYAVKTTPRQFMQEILERLKVAGGPVEWGGLGLRLARGVLTKCKSSPRGPGYFTYCWLSEEAWKIISDYRRDSGFESMESGVLQ